MKIYQDALGNYVLWTDREKLHYGTSLEAKEVMTRLELIKAIVQVVQQAVPLMDEGPDVLQEYFDSGITITDEDVASLGLVAADVTACLTLLENIDKFFSGTVSIDAVYRVTVNKVRRVLYD